jgi:hypothetical protein
MTTAFCPALSCVLARRVTCLIAAKAFSVMSSRTQLKAVVQSFIEGRSGGVVRRAWRQWRSGVAPDQLVTAAIGLPSDKQCGRGGEGAHW